MQGRWAGASLAHHAVRDGGDAGGHDHTHAVERGGVVDREGGGGEVLDDALQQQEEEEGLGLRSSGISPL